MAENASASHTWTWMNKIKDKRPNMYRKLNSMNAIKNYAKEKLYQDEKEEPSIF